MTGRIIGAMAIFLLAVPAAVAQSAGQSENCAAYAGWPAPPLAVTSSPAEYDLPVARLLTGHAAVATLHPVEAATFLADPERWPEPGGWAGLLGFTAEVAGLYRVSLSEGAWIDVVNGEGELVPSEAFGHGPECDGLRKVVEFDLASGDYALQISGNPDAEITVMVSRIR